MTDKYDQKGIPSTNRINHQIELCWSVLNVHRNCNQIFSIIYENSANNFNKNDSEISSTSVPKVKTQANNCTKPQPSTLSLISTQHLINPSSSLQQTVFSHQKASCFPPVPTRADAKSIISKTLGSTNYMFFSWLNLWLNVLFLCLYVN
jgi:hypothetical protein